MTGPPESPKQMPACMRRLKPVFSTFEIARVAEAAHEPEVGGGLPASLHEAVRAVADDGERVLLVGARQSAGGGELRVAAVGHRGVEDDQREVVRVRAGGAEARVWNCGAGYDLRARGEALVEGDERGQVAEVVDAVRRGHEGRPS